ncbi:MAG TPA: nucleotide exchange factor GrpE [bacterium]|nr:nucleotide exchange factor GrpE [bacterium]
MSEQVINPAGDAAPTPETPVENAAAPLAGGDEWQKKHDEVKEKLLWMTADFENYKKRALKDKEDHLKFSQAGLLKEVLLVADNLERALLALPADDNDKGLLSLKQGVDLTLKQFNSILAKYNVTKIKAKGEKFDPHQHEVMFQEETTEFPDGTVLEELQSGYMLHDRVLRPAMVKIAKNS